jgi:hypothetical protein
LRVVHDLEALDSKEQLCQPERGLAGQFQKGRGRNMKLKFLGSLVLLVAAATFAFADSTMTGYISDSHCGAKGAKAGHAECATKCVTEHGAKYVFVDDADHKVYAIDAQDKVAAHAGHHVTVKGTVDGDNLKLASIEMAK